MIRINLLPQAMRRRRLALPRELVVAMSMLLGWALVVSAGYMWIAGYNAEAARLRAQTAEAETDIRRLRGQGDNPQLSLRQQKLFARRDAIARLRDERRGPLAALGELAALLGGLTGEGGQLRLVELRAPSAATWRVVGTARDATALADLIRRLRGSERFKLSFGPEYVRAGDDRLLFHVDLAVAAWE